MPVNPEAHLISSVIREGDYKTAVAHGVTEEMFHTYQEEWQWVEAYVQTYKRPPTLNAFRSAFPEFRIYKVKDTGYFADEVRRQHANNMLIEVMHKAAELLADGDIETAVKKMTNSAIGIAATLGTNSDTDIFTDFNDVLADVEGRVRRVKELGSAGIPYGIPTLDKYTGGSYPGDLIIVGGRLGQGKSWVLQKMATNAAVKGYAVAFNALEQSRAQVTLRVHTLLSSDLGKEVFKNTALMQGKDFSVKAYKEFLKTLKHKITGRLHVSDTSRGKVGPLHIAAQIERHRPDIVYIDYLTLLKKSGPDWQGVAELSGDMKNLATSYQIPIIAAAQLNRTYGLTRGEPADPEALAGSDAIGQDADGVVTIRQVSRSVLQMKMAKNRSGPGGFKWWVDFRPGDGIIRECSYQRAMELRDQDDDAQDAEEDQ